MSESNEDLIKAYVNQLMKIQNEQKPLSDQELSSIANDLGISEDQMQMINKRFMDCLTRGQGYSRYEDWDSAIYELEQAVELKPNQVDAVYGLANAYKYRWLIKKNKEDLNKAKALVKRVLYINPSHDPSLRLSSELNKGVISNSGKGIFNTNTKNFFPKELDSFAPAKRLKRSAIDKKIFGVCGGIAEYFGIDASFVRVLAALSIFVDGGASILIYIILSFVLPKR